MTEAGNSVAATNPAAQARRLIRSNDRAALASPQHDAGGWPYASLVLCAADHDGSPILLLSDLAEHSKNVAADARVSLLFDGTAGLDDPLTGARVTVLGNLYRQHEDRVRRRFLARHPAAAGYAEFSDFHFYRLEIARAHLVAGFGAIDWIDGAALLFDMKESQALSDAETDIVDHMNHDHADAIEAYARGLLGLPGAEWTMTGIDPEGFDLRCGGSVARLVFDDPVNDAARARQALVAMVRAARSEIPDPKAENDS